MNKEEVRSNAEKNLQTIISKAWEDEAFKATLLDDPVSAIESLAGQPLDLKGKKIVVTDQSDTSTMYINIPHNPADVELTEEELEAVAGGEFHLTLVWSFICFGWD